MMEITLILALDYSLPAPNRELIHFLGTKSVSLEQNLFYESGIYLIGGKLPLTGAPHAVRSVRFAPYQIFLAKRFF